MITEKSTKTKIVSCECICYYFNDKVAKATQYKPGGKTFIKKILALTLALVLGLSLCACGEKAPEAFEVHNYADLAANNTFTTKDGLAEDEDVFVASRLDLIYQGVKLKDASVYFNVVDGKLVANFAQ